MCSFAPSSVSSTGPSTSKYLYGSSLSQTLIETRGFARRLRPFARQLVVLTSDVLAVGVDPDDARLHASVLADSGDDAEVEPPQELDVLCAECRHLTVVGMFVILPDAICCLITATFAAIPAGVFGENLPMPTPPMSRP